MCASDSKKCSFFGKFDVLCFVTSVLRFAFLPMLFDFHIKWLVPYEMQRLAQMGKKMKFLTFNLKKIDLFVK